MKTNKILIYTIIITALTLIFIKREAISDFSQSNNEAEMLYQKIEQKNQSTKPFYQGEVVNLEHAGGYTYIEVREKTDMTFWIAVERTDVKKGDYIRFQKELVTKNFKSKALDKTFKEIMFASNLQYKVKK